MSETERAAPMLPNTPNGALLRTDADVVLNAERTAGDIGSSLFLPCDEANARRTGEQVADRAVSNARVYFFDCPGAGAIKIGWSDDPEARLRACQTGCPLPITLLGSIPGDYREERRIHGRFSDLRIHGEWFRSEQALVEFIGNAMAVATGAPHVPSDPRELVVEHDGERRPLGAWCRDLGLSEMAVLGRLVDGLTFAQAIVDPWVLSNRPKRRPKTS